MSRMVNVAPLGLLLLALMQPAFAQSPAPTEQTSPPTMLFAPRSATDRTPGSDLPASLPALPSNVTVPSAAGTAAAPAAGATVRIPAPAPAAFSKAAAQAISANPADTRQAIMRLRDLGRAEGVLLEGFAAERTVTFTVRQDDALVASKIGIVVSYSAAVGREEGEVAVFLNDEPIGVLPVGRSKGARTRADLAVNPALFSTENRLRFRFSVKGKGANACKIAADPSYWVRIEPASYVFVSVTRLSVPDDLASLPRPFVDPKDPLPATLGFVLPARPETGVVQAAATAAAYFGIAAGDKAARFPVTFETVPAGDAVVLVEADRYPAGVAPVPGSGPRIAVIAHPTQANAKLLVLVGANAAELQTAAAVLALDPSHLAGPSAEAHESPAPERLPYDAPKWIATDRPVRLGDLIDATALAGRGLRDGVQIPFRIAPDLYFGSREGGELQLRLRRAVDSWIDVGNSRVALLLNRKEIGAVPIEPKLKVLSRLMDWLIPGNAEDRISHVFMPVSKLQGDNRLDFKFDLRANQAADCANLDWSDRTGIDPESRIDLTHAAHFASLPNLTLFAGSGFPFTRLADLGDTAFVLGDEPSSEDVRTVLELAAHFAQVTGVAATRHAVVAAQQVDTVTDRNLIVIGLVSSQPLLRTWESENSVHLADGSIASSSAINRLLGLLHPYTGWGAGGQGGAGELARTTLDKPRSYLSSFISPLNPSRVVVSIGGTNDRALADMSRELADPERSARIRGDFFLLSEGKSESYVSGRERYFGQLPPWWRLQWLAGALGLAVFAVALGAVLSMAAAIRIFAIDRARRVLAIGLLAENPRVEPSK